MLSALFLGSLLLAAMPDSAALDAYETARVNAKQDPDAHVRLAVWCELHGLDAYKMKHLALAVLIDPAHATARGLLGMIADRGKWQRPEAVSEKRKADQALSAALAEYNAKRALLKNTADDHWKLALWCEQKGLKAEAMAHLTTVTRLDPGREPAWKRLGYQKHNGRWLTDRELAAERAEAEAQKKADRVWKPKLQALRGRLDDRIPARRAEAEKTLGEVNDPRAVNAIWTVFVSDRNALPSVAVRLLGQINDPASSRALALLAAFAPQAEVRQIARETLRNRDPREFVGSLLRFVRKPIRYKTDLSQDSEGKLRRVLFVEGKKTDYVCEFDTPLAYTDVRRFLPRLFADNMPFDPASPMSLNTPVGWTGGPVFDANAAQLFQSMLAHPAQAAATAAQHGLSQSQASNGHHAQQIAPAYSAADVLVQNATRAAQIRDLQNAQIAIANAQSVRLRDSMMFQQTVAALEENNQFVATVSPKVVDALNQITGQDLPSDADEWQRWWLNVQGYSYTTPPDQFRNTVFLSFPSCFAKGTTVKTLGGSLPIEAINVGDQVLAQDAHTGALSFQVVTVIHHNPPGETLRIRLKDEEILPTVHHRFWRASEGWVKARDLKSGDTIRTLTGLARIEAIESAGVQPVYNLDVSTCHSFFVGRAGALVHDNTLPPLRLEPFDASLRPDANAALASTPELTPQ